MVFRVYSSILNAKVNQFVIALFRELDSDHCRWIFQSRSSPLLAFRLSSIILKAVPRLIRSRRSSSSDTFNPPSNSIDLFEKWRMSTNSTSDIFRYDSIANRPVGTETLLRVLKIVFRLSRQENFYRLILIFLSFVLVWVNSKFRFFMKLKICIARKTFSFVAFPFETAVWYLEYFEKS